MGLKPSTPLKTLQTFLNTLFPIMQYTIIPTRKMQFYCECMRHWVTIKTTTNSKNRLRFRFPQLQSNRPIEGHVFVDRCVESRSAPLFLGLISKIFLFYLIKLNVCLNVVYRKIFGMHNNIQPFCDRLYFICILFIRNVKLFNSLFFASKHDVKLLRNHLRLCVMRV